MDSLEFKIDLDDEYIEMMQEILRVITVACTVQLIKTMTFGGEFFTDAWLEATSNTVLGFAMYYLVIKKIIIFN